MHERKIAVGLILVILLSTSIIVYNLVLENEEDEISFFVFGDSQGYQGGLIEIASIANQFRPDFVVHCGDLTPFGTEEQYTEVRNVLGEFNVPVYTVAGNHDIRLDGATRYTEVFGPRNYSFDFRFAHFTFYDSATGDVEPDELEWLGHDLENTDRNNKFVFTHMPPFDPREGLNHSMDNMTTASRLMELFTEAKVDTVFSGHIHIYNSSTSSNVTYVITGGAGASLYASEEEGGVYHFLNVTVSRDETIIDMVPLGQPSISRDSVVIRSADADVTLSLSDLQIMESSEGTSSFQNQYGNWRGQGTYRGVSISNLVDHVGGMEEGDVLRVIAEDGFTQEFCYCNVFPNASWQSIQGDMILAYQYNNSVVPEWSDGMRLVFLPEDGAYSNQDCLDTSAPGMGCNVYMSAGSRWVRFVSVIQVVKT